MKAVSFGLVLMGLAIACLLIAGQAPFDASIFEFGEYREYEGSLEAWPYPMLVTPNGRYLLAGEGKHGTNLDALSGNRVALQGALIQHGSDRMLQVLRGSVRVISDKAIPDAVADLGPLVLRGEIVDTKCYLGVMNPGRGKVHRDCAVRCISGGVPPAFLVRDAHGDARVLLLTGADGRRLSGEILPFVGEPIQVSGRLERRGSTLVLKAEPADFLRE